MSLHWKVGLSHWTTREVLDVRFFINYISINLLKELVLPEQVASFLSLSSLSAVFFICLLLCILLLSWGLL